MDSSRWKEGDEFSVLELVAKLRFKTSSSLSFQLGSKGNTLQLPDMEEPWVMGAGSVFTIIGWLDVHHPCEGFHRLQIRVGLPDSYVCWESMRDVVADVKAALGLPADESYHIYLAGLSMQTSMEEPQSGWVCTTRWEPPA